MALAIVPAAAGATAALFLGEPAFQMSRSLTDRFIDPAKHRTTNSWAHTVLNGGSFGFGALTLAATVSPAIPLLPAMGIGVVGGMLAALTLRLAKTGIFAAHRYLEAKWSFYNKVSAWVRKTITGLPGWIKFPFELVASFVKGVPTAGRAAQYTQTIESFAPAFMRRPLSLIGGFIAAMVDKYIAAKAYVLGDAVLYLKPPRWAGAMLLVPLMIADYIRRTGAVVIIKGVSLFAPLHLRIAFTLGMVALMFWVGGTVNSVIDQVFPRGEAVVASAMKAEDELAQKLADLETQTAETVKIVKEQVTLNKEAVERVNAAAATATADSVVPPAPDAPPARRVVPMGGDDLYTKAMEKAELEGLAEAHQTLVDAAAVQTGQPMQQKRRPGRPPGKKATPAKVVHTTRSTTK